MKKIILILIPSILISLSVYAQSAGDYRSIGNGNWNDATSAHRSFGEGGLRWATADAIRFFSSSEFL